MRLGYLTSYRPGEFEIARKIGFDAIELRVGWKTDEGRIDAGAETAAIVEEMDRTGIGVTALACYAVPPVQDAAGIRQAFTQLAPVAQALKTDVIATMAYRSANTRLADDLPAFAKSFGVAAQVAEDNGLKIAIENWPGSITGYGPYTWRSMAIAPLAWEMLFEAVPCKALGLEYDPSHLFWQQVDYVKAISDFRTRIHHVHAKDTLTNPKALAKGGVHASGWWRFTIPGLGEVDWQAVFGALAKIGYRGDMAIEHEDAKYSGPRRDLGLKKGLSFLRPMVAKMGVRAGRRTPGTRKS